MQRNIVIQNKLELHNFQILNMNFPIILYKIISTLGLIHFTQKK